MGERKTIPFRGRDFLAEIRRENRGARGQVGRSAAATPDRDLALVEFAERWNFALMKCPLDERFFREIGRVHRSQVRKEIRRKWGEMPRLDDKIRSRLWLDGYISIWDKGATDWKKAFRFAERWNKYEGYQADVRQFQKEIEQEMWDVCHGVFQIDTPTWLTLASMAFSHDNEKESPNHLFLKELFRFYIHRFYPLYQLELEYQLDLFGDVVQCDLVVLTKQTDQIELIGEMGGVQLWKVMGALHKGYSIMVMPHWTRQKTNPFIRKKLEFDYYLFRRRRE